MIGLWYDYTSMIRPIGLFILWIWLVFWYDSIQPRVGYEYVSNKGGLGIGIDSIEHEGRKGGLTARPSDDIIDEGRGERGILVQNGADPHLIEAKCRRMQRIKDAWLPWTSVFFIFFFLEEEGAWKDMFGGRGRFFVAKSLRQWDMRSGSV